jgi:predicted TPR repeat methyltransferase
LREEPDNPIARHLLAACSGQQTPKRASDSYIERTFDDFAASFDAKLEQLHYRAPELVASVLAQVRPEARRHDDVADLGCGTGLCGALVAPWARRLVGVDLSENMLARAREKGVYDELVRSELTTYLRENAAAFDIVVSADTLVYFGPLETVLGAAARALRPGGALVFTLEEAEGSAPHRLNFHGRYSHTPAYVASALAQAGLEPTIVPAQLRLEAGRPVGGMVVAGTKPLRDAARPGGGHG